MHAIEEARRRAAATRAAELLARLGAGRQGEPREGPPGASAESERVHEWARALLETFNQQKLADNGMIWEIGKLFVPLSLVPFGTLIVDKGKPTLFATVLCALASCGLYGLWILYANKMRDFQDKNVARQHAILDALTVFDATDDATDFHVYHSAWPINERPRYFSIQRLRSAGFWILVIAWSGLMLVGRGSSPSECATNWTFNACLRDLPIELRLLNDGSSLSGSSLK